MSFLVRLFWFSLLLPNSLTFIRHTCMLMVEIHVRVLHVLNVHVLLLTYMYMLLVSKYPAFTLSFSFSFSLSFTLCLYFFFSLSFFFLSLFLSLLPPTFITLLVYLSSLLRWMDIYQEVSSPLCLKCSVFYMEAIHIVITIGTCIWHFVYVCIIMG